MKRLIFFMSLILLFTSCKPNDIVYRTNKKIARMNSYSALCEVTVYGNKENSKYTIKQFYKASGRMRIEVVEPDYLKGKAMVISNSKCKIYHPLINQTIIMDIDRIDERFTGIGIIQKSLITGEKSKYKEITKNGKEYVQIRCMIPDGNEYRKYAILYLGIREYSPEYLEIYDENNNLRVHVKYTDFHYNCNINDSLFEDI